MKKIDHWDGQLEDTKIEYEVMTDSVQMNQKVDSFGPSTVSIIEYDKPDKMDYLVAASSGVLTGLLNSFWVGEFSLRNAQDWGRKRTNSFVIKVAQIRGYKKDELEGAIRFLEKDAPIPSDKLTGIWGGGLQHHFRDFSHHASVVGLVFSILTQFTGMSYGTDMKGHFEIYELPDRSLIGNNFEEKIFNGVVIWALHLVSDMAGSSNNAGKGTGIPGPILSLIKELSVLPYVRNLNVSCKNKQISMSMMLSKIFNGTAFEHASTKDLIRFDLRTELGIYAYGTKQSITVVLNQCLIRAFFFVRRLCYEIKEKQIRKISEIKNLEPRHFMPFNNKCILRMATIASGVFCTVNASDAAIRAFISSPSDREEFATKFLLRTNFIGIGNFVVSIKNDIVTSVTDMAKADYVMITKKPELPEANDQLSIDIAVDIDNTGLYEYFFYRMYNHVKKAKENFNEAQRVNSGMQRQLFQLEDDDTKLFDTVAKASGHSLLVETEKLMMQLFTFYGVNYIPFEDDSKYRVYMPFYRFENGRKIGYAFSQSITKAPNLDKYKDKLDCVKVVALVELGGDTETRNVIIDENIRKSGGFLQYCTLHDLFALISEDEYAIYLNYVEKYSADIKKLIGYRTIVIPSEESIMELKENIVNEFKDFDFDSCIEGVYENQLSVLKKNFWGREFYRAIVGNAAFAESFTSSEWYYQTHAASSALEQTAIVAGYLKSVEQLLYSIVELSIDTGKSIRKNGVGKAEYIEYSTINIDSADKTLGSIIGYVRHYSDLWDVNSYVKNYIADKLNEYRDKYRNDHLHRDNIRNIEEIKEIRDNTILMYYLMLGGMHILDEDKECIGISVEPEKVNSKHDLEYSDVEKWLDRILGGDVLLDKSIPIYFCIGVWGEDQWRLEFSTVSGFMKEGFPENIQWPYIGDDLKWDYVLEKEENIQKVVGIIKKYLQEGKYSGILKAHPLIAVGWFGRPQIVYQR